MDLREAAQQALDALIWTTGSKDFSEGGQAREGALNLLFPAITALRAALAEPTSQESRQVEPVAYVSGFSKGYAVVQPVDRSLLMPVGMALYRSPPTINEMETVEPVAWMVYTLDGQSAFVTDNPADFAPEHRALPLYTAPPKREPLTEAELEPIRRRMMMEAYNEADDGDSERYNALKVMANDVLDMLLGGEK